VDDPSDELGVERAWLERMRRRLAQEHGWERARARAGALREGAPPPADDTYGRRSHRWHGISHAVCHQEMARVRSFHVPSTATRAAARIAVTARYARMSPADRRALGQHRAEARRTASVRRAAAVAALVTAISEAVALQRAPGGGIYRQRIALPSP